MPSDGVVLIGTTPDHENMHTREGLPQLAGPSCRCPYVTGRMDKRHVRQGVAGK